MLSRQAPQHYTRIQNCQSAVEVVESVNEFLSGAHWPVRALDAKDVAVFARETCKQYVGTTKDDPEAAIVAVTLLTAWRRLHQLESGSPAFNPSDDSGRRT